MEFYLHVTVYGLYVKSAQIKNQELKKLKCRFEDLSPQTFQSSLCRNKSADLLYLKKKNSLEQSDVVFEFLIPLWT